MCHNPKLETNNETPNFTQRTIQYTSKQQHSLYVQTLSAIIYIDNIIMNSGSGIQELMAAETRASQIVAEARIGKFSF